MARRLIKVLVWSLGFALAALLTVLTVFVLSFDANDYRARIERAVSEAIGRTVRIAGQVEIAPALIPTVAVNDVTIANPPWASGPTMASAGRLEVSIALLPLLNGDIQISTIALERVDLRLERSAEQRGNWEFDFLTDAEAAEQSTNRYRTRIGEIALREISARYATADGRELVSRIDRVTLRHLPNRAIEIEGAGRLGELPVSVHWQAGPLDARSTDAGLRWPIAARGEIGATAVSLVGRLRAPLAYADSAFDLKLSSRDATRWRSVLGLRGDEALAYALSGSVRIDARGVRIRELTGALETGTAIESLRIESGHLTLERGARIDAMLSGRVSGQPFTISSRLGALSEILRATPWPLDLALSLNDLRLDASGQVAGKASEPRVAVALTATADSLASLNRLARWQLPELGSMTLESTLVLEPARVSLSPLQLGVAGNTISGDLEITGPLAHPRIEADLSAPSLDLASLSAAAPGRTAAPLLDSALPVAWLERADAEIALRLGALHGLPVGVGRVAARANLSGGVLQLRVGEAQVAGLGVSGTAQLARTANRASIDLELETAALDLNTVLRALGRPEPFGIELTASPASIALQASGATVRAAAATGTARLRGGQGHFALTGGAPSMTAELASWRLDVVPGSPTRLQTQGQLEARIAGRDIAKPFDLTVTGGSMADLMATRRWWPRMNVALNSEHRGEPVVVEGLIADTATLLDGEPAAVRFDGIWGPWQARFDGAAAFDERLAGSAGALTVATPDLAAAAALLDVPGLPAGAASLSGRAEIDTGRITLGSLALAAPGIEGTGELSLERDDGSAIRGRLGFATLDLTSYFAAEPPPPARESNDPPSPSPLFSAEPLPLASLRHWNLDLGATAEQLRFGRFSTSGASARVAADGAAIELDAALDDGRINAHARLDMQSSDTEFSFRTTGEDVPIAADLSGDPAPGTPVIDFEAALSGRGASSQEIVRSLGGDLLLYLRGGRFESSGLRFIFGSILYELLNVINPFSQRQSFVDIECAGAYFTVADGSLSTENGIVIQTPELQVVGVGDMRLATSELTMDFRTKRRTGIMISIGGIVNEFVELTGTLEAPRIGISPERAARSGLLAIATGGLSLLATDMFNRITSEDVCSQLPTIVGAPGSDQ